MRYRLDKSQFRCQLFCTLTLKSNIFVQNISGIMKKNVDLSFKKKAITEKLT